MSEAKHLHCIARIQAAAFGLTEEAMIERLEAGMYPGLVAGYMKLVAQRNAERSRIMTVFEKMAPGYTLMISEQEILIKGPYCQYLSKALLSINGYWDGQGGRNRRCFVIQPDAETKIERCLHRWKQLSAQGSDPSKWSSNRFVTSG
ncbi:MULTISPECIES: hypothetical protein [Pseudomonas]|uniref:Uncharacterized protein n=1 Tax=Pseudomonas lutea TaxID=243924 RepID=A0A9X8QLT5_9PSED|nr:MULTISPECIES: hypothetical protein [Pseudomonas]SER39486.1 hypothetical protein SAMN05216409_11919 [Pseudomonas lutea]